MSDVKNLDPVQRRIDAEIANVGQAIQIARADVEKAKKTPDRKDDEDAAAGLLSAERMLSELTAQKDSAQKIGKHVTALLGLFARNPQPSLEDIGRLAGAKAFYKNGTLFVCSDAEGSVGTRNEFTLAFDLVKVCYKYGIGLSVVNEIAFVKKPYEIENLAKRLSTIPAHSYQAVELKCISSVEALDRWLITMEMEQSKPRRS